MIYRLIFMQNYFVVDKKIIDFSNLNYGKMFTYITNTIKLR